MLKQGVEGDRRISRRIPENVRALPISDFDPLPPEMPIIASIVEAWHQLAMEYDKETSLPEDCDDAEIADGSVAWTVSSGGRRVVSEVKGSGVDGSGTGSTRESQKLEAAGSAMARVREGSAEARQMSQGHRIDSL